MAFQKTENSDRNEQKPQQTDAHGHPIRPRSEQKSSAAANQKNKSDFLCRGRLLRAQKVYAPSKAVMDR